MAEVSFGEWLRSQRRACGWTQKELALQLHCSISTVRKMEAEVRRPSVQTLERLADIFNIPPTERKLFLQFARGDWQAGIPNGRDNPWQIPQTGSSPAITMDLIGSEEVDGLLRLAGESPNVYEKLALIHQALELAELLGDVRRQVDCLWQLGWSDNIRRFSYWERAIKLARPLGNVQELADHLSSMGFFLVLNGDIKAAQVYLDESSALYQKLNKKPAAIFLLSAQGHIALLRGDFDKARMYLQEHARIALEYGSRGDFLWSQVRLGYVALRAENLDEARDLFSETARNFQLENMIGGVVFTLEGIAGLLLQQGKTADAAMLVGWANATRSKTNDTRPLLEQADIEKVISACKEAMGSRAFSNAYEAGGEMTTAEAVKRALEES